jgi:hypothetical protein
MRKAIEFKDRNYFNNFKESVEFTQEMGLALPLFEINPDVSYDVPFLSNYILNELYTHSKFQIEDVAQKCFLLSKHLQSFLKLRCNIPSIITSGCLFENGFQVYGEEKEKIKARLNSKGTFPPVKFHTWLTLKNFDVVDITYQPTLWYYYKIKGQEVNEEEFKKLIWFHSSKESGDSLCYKPMFLGYEYFEKVKIAYRLSFIIKD